MITQDNLAQLLDQLGFTQAGQRHSKAIGDATLTVDRKKGEIFYPEAQGLVINERQTCNLSFDENFVVLECVHRLLEKGYKPANIELEPKWKLGHGASGGRADKGKASKSINQANINATIMRNIKVPVPPLAEQRHIVADIEAEQRTIAAADAIIAAAPARKQAILERYL